jgi:hypothetical protein
MHSTGWMPTTRKFCARRSIGVSRNIANGACLNLIATSVTRVSNALPVRRKNGTPAHRQLSIWSLRAA